MLQPLLSTTSCLILLVIAAQAQQPELKQQISRILVTPGSGPAMAVADFVGRNEPALRSAALITEVLRNDLSFAGVTNFIGQSLYPKNTPAEPSQVDFAAWGREPVHADYLLFGSVVVIGETLLLESYLYDVQARNRLLSVQYRTPVSEARSAAHKLSDEIVKVLTGSEGVASSRIAFVRGHGSQGDIYIMDYDGANMRPLTDGTSLSVLPSWSPDGRWIAYVSFQTGLPNIHVRSARDGIELPFPRFNRGTTLSPNFSPDGKLLAFCSSKDSTSTQLYISDVDGSNIRQLTNQPGVIHSSPRWNPRTGREIAFISNQSGTPQIYVIDVDGSNLRRLLDRGGYADAPAWSPDGRYVAFTWRPPSASHFDIFLIDVATQQILQLTDGPGDNESPSWSPDGRHIAFQSNRSGRFEIYLMHIDGTGVKQITTSGGRSPAWSR